MIPSDVLGKLRPAPEDCSRGAVTVTNPSLEREAAAAHNPGERIPSSFVNRICGFEFDINIPENETNKKERQSAPRFHEAPPARLEHATYCSASKRSNPLSYGGILAGKDSNSELGGGQAKRDRISDLLYQIAKSCFLAPNPKIQGRS